MILMEERILQALQFELTFPTPFSFLDRFLRLADLHKHSNVIKMSTDLLQVASTHSIFLDCRPSIIAAAAIVLSMNLTHGTSESNRASKSYSFDYWTHKLEVMTGIEIEDIEDVFNVLVDAAI